MIDNDATSHLTLGRQTVSIGSASDRTRELCKRHQELHRRALGYYSGQDVQLPIYVVPINLRPSIQTNILDNELKSDKEQWQRRLWGHISSKENLSERV